MIEDDYHWCEGCRGNDPATCPFRPPVSGDTLRLLELVKREGTVEDWASDDEGGEYRVEDFAPAQLTVAILRSDWLAERLKAARDEGGSTGK